MLDPPPSDKAAMVNIIEMVYEVQIPENAASFAWGGLGTVIFQETALTKSLIVILNCDEDRLDKSEKPRIIKYLTREKSIPHKSQALYFKCAECDKAFQ
jgi:hypothetical protein